MSTNGKKQWERQRAAMDCGCGEHYGKGYDDGYLVGRAEGRADVLEALGRRVEALLDTLRDLREWKRERNQ